MYRQTRERLTGVLPVSTPSSSSSSYEDEEDYYVDSEKDREGLAAGWTNVGPLPRRKVHSSENVLWAC
jgi:hypothetical protein